jgi:hypothetical protein
VNAPQQEEFIAWLKRLEYGLYSLPAEDLVLYMRLPVAEAHRLVGMKEARTYTTARRDLQEADVRHLEHAAVIYERLATQPNWATIECSGAASDPAPALLSPEQIHAAVLKMVWARLPSLAEAAKPNRKEIA